IMKTGARIALCLSQGGTQTQDFMKHAEAYCEERGYYLWNGDIYQEQGSPIALDWIKEVMSSLAVRTLLIPSLEHIHPTNIGYILNFLIEAQVCMLEIVCLDTIPIPLSHFTLAFVSLTDEQLASGAVSLPEILRDLHFG